MYPIPLPNHGGQDQTHKTYCHVLSDYWRGLDLYLDLLHT
jgi:hypothetical protein